MIFLLRVDLDLGFADFFAILCRMFETIFLRNEIMEAYIEAFKAIPDAPQRALARYGLGAVGPNGQFEVIEWVPVAKWLLVLNELEGLMGPQKAVEIGMNIVDRIVFPPEAKDIQSAFQLFDVGYHINHVKDGQPMFDPATGTMVDGIGHYKCTYVSKRRAVLEVDAPYPCDLDRGIVQGWARRYEKTAIVTHLEPSVCRKTRGRACRYEVSWK